MTIAARAHLTALVALFVLLKAIAYVLDRRALLLEYNEGADLYGAGYTDINALLPAKEILAYISDRGGDRDPGLLQRGHAQPGLAGHLAGPARHLRGGHRRHLPVGGADSSRSSRAPGTRRRRTSSGPSRRPGPAYGMTDVEDARRTRRTTSPRRPRWPPTSRWCRTIRLLDPQLVTETYTQLQQVRGFYDFGEKLDIDRYTIDGKTAGLRGRRPGDQLRRADRAAEQLDQPAHRLHPRVRLRRRAGQPGVCDGAAVLRLRLPRRAGTSEDAGCASATEQIPVEQPRIYYGERMAADDYAIVGKAGERRRRVRPADRRRRRAVLHLRRRGRCRDRLVHPAAALRASRSRSRTSCSPTRSTTTRSSSTCATRATGWRRSRRS